MRNIVLFLLIGFLVGGVAIAGVKKRVRPYQYGGVVIDRYSTEAGLKPVKFDHWVHRAKFTCRVCHVDLAFAMKTGETGIRAVDNQRGYFCGACHNGRSKFSGATLFRACSDQKIDADSGRCSHCHFEGDEKERENAFFRFRARLPKERLGNGIDWEEAEDTGLIKPADHLPGISVKRAKLAVQQDFSLDAKVAGMPQIIFSHEKHTVWNGCEVCHPDIFIGIKKGATTYSMIELFNGEYCGVCHDTVAFPQKDCQRCHTGQVL